MVHIKCNVLNWLQQIWLFAFCSFMSLSTFSAFASRLPITNELIQIMDHDESLKSLLIESIEKAKKINPDPKTNPVQTLEEYYDFLDFAATALPWLVLKQSPSLYDQIDQSLDYFYFIPDQPLPELENKGYYYNSLQYHEPFRSWMILFTQEYGDFLNSTASWNDDYLKMAQADPRFGLQQDWYEDSSHWKTFNQFFSRYLKSPAARPIAFPDDPSIIAAPADSVPQGIWKIDEKSRIETGVRVKSKIFQSVPDLLGPNSAYHQAFAGGTFTHTFLDVNDYHRYHFPVSGTIKEVRLIEQDDAAGGVTEWDPIRKKYVLHSKIPGWESIETRGCVIVDTKDYGLVALLPIGMSQVSSVNFEAGVKVGKDVKKGDMLGYFLFGGSDFVMVFQKQVRFDLTVPSKGGDYAHVLMGEKYGKVTHKNQRNFFRSKH